jgi:transcriptional regulator with XRE-family HTH domain
VKLEHSSTADAAARSHISLRELAKKIGVSGAFLSDIELGRRFPSQDKIELLAEEIGVLLAGLISTGDIWYQSEVISHRFHDPR